MNGLLNSFRNAFRGIWSTLKAERNMRIHLTAAVYVTVLGFLAELDAPRWAAILLCFGAVIAAELFNTALENLCDVVHPNAHPKIGAVKDAGAGAVLILALCSVGVAIATFGPWLLNGGLVRAMCENKILLPAFPVSLIPAILWIRGKKSWKSKNQA